MTCTPAYHYYGGDDDDCDCGFGAFDGMDPTSADLRGVQLL